MNHYRRQLLLTATPAAVYEALTTSEGLRGWWTQTCDIATGLGKSTFRFNNTYKVMQVEYLEPEREVRWQCVEAHLEAPGVKKTDEWIGTQIVFKLSPDGGGKTQLDLQHLGLTPALECFELCQGGWNHFLASLQSFVETGKGTPLVPDNPCQAGADSAESPKVATDRIERSIHIEAPRSKVWRALSNAEAYGKWFGANLTGKSFTPGHRVQGPITIPGYEHIMFDVVIERIEPEHLMSYRWHPYPVDPAIDYSKEERTLVTFTLKDAEGGTLLTVTESGFDKVSPDRRLEAFRMNTNGWEAQLRNIDRYATSQGQNAAQAHS
ncbi:MAG TPA: SRPBCC domain-containing protein [Chthoniobacteraceae bacterium]|jgi:uncharacterized protein YndB with AHSA1/START domain